MQLHNVWVPTSWGLGRGQKVKYHSISIKKTISKIYKPNFVCLLTRNERYKTCLTGFSFGRLDHAPGFGTWRCWGGGGVQNFYFLNMVMWHIKLKGMSSRHGYTEKILSYDQTGDLGMGSKDQIPYISSRAWGFAMARHRMCSSYIFESSL